MRKIADQWLRDILLVLYQHRNVTRAEIIADTGLNPASVSHALRFLLGQGTVLKVGDLASDGGRKREVFNLNAEAAYFVAVDLEGQRIRFALMNSVGDVRYRWEEDLERGEPLDVNKLFVGVAKLLRNLDARQHSRVVAAGISYPGLLDAQGRLTAVNLAWRKFPLLAELRAKARLHKMSGLPIFLEPDRHSSVFAERWLGCAKGHQNGLLLFSERGIGIGVFLDGKPVVGWRNMAGEIGHITIDPDSEEQCGCGKRGCLETVASSSNIIRQYVAESPQGPRDASSLRITDIFEKARQKDAIALAVVERAAKAIGMALSHAISLLNPSIVILAGDLASGEDLLLPLVEKEIGRHTLADLSDGLQIKASGLGLDMRLKGAAALAFRQSLADPALLKKMCSPALARHKAAAV
jgi:glucokinase